jgi:transposase
MNYVGLDVGLRKSSLHILDSNGKAVKRKEVAGGWGKLIEAVRQIPRPFMLCYEASCGYGYLFDHLSPLAERVAVGHPGQLRLIFKAKRKNNRVDAEKLAKLLYLDAVPQVHVPSVNVRAWRALIEFRQKLLRRRVSLKNQIRALLRGLGIAVVRGLWTKKGLAWLAEQELSSMDDLRRAMMVDDLLQANARIRQIELELKKIADGHLAVTLLRTIPGVGIRTAEAFVAYVADPRRFSRLNRIGAYLGLVPCQDATGDRNRLGHITREGPATVRKLLCEAAWQGIRRDLRTRAYFERVMHGEPERKKIAIVATAHRLARVMLAMLKSGEVYRKVEERTDGDMQAKQGLVSIQEKDRCASGPSIPPLLAHGTPALSRIRRDQGQRGRKGKKGTGVATRGASSLTAPE